MTAQWLATTIGASMAAAAAAAAIWRGGRRDGKIDAVLERLTSITEDHEDRLRVIELRPPRRHR